MPDNDNGKDTPGAGAGTTLLLTRPRAQSEAFAERVLGALPGVRIVVAPLMEIAPIGTPPSLEGLSGVIFTSANAVPLAGDGGNLPAWCVGARTTAAAKAGGFHAVFAGENADGLVQYLTAQPPKGRILHLHGRHTRGDVSRRLASAGIAAESHPIYDQPAIEPGKAFFDALDVRPLVVPLFSPRTAALFAEAVRGTKHARPVPGACVVALSNAVRDALSPEWFEIADVCDTPDATAMLDGIARRVYP